MRDLLILCQPKYEHYFFFFLPFLPHLSIYLFLKKLFLLGGSLLYNTVLVSAIHQHDVKQVASGNLLFDTGSSNLRQPGAVGWDGRCEAGSRIVLLSCWKVGWEIHLWRGRRSCQRVDWCRGPDDELASNVTLGTTSLPFLRSTFLRNKSNSASSGAARTSQGVPAPMLCKLDVPPRCEGPGSGSTLAPSRWDLRILFQWWTFWLVSAFRLAWRMLLWTCVHMTVCAPTFNPLALCSAVESPILRYFYFWCFEVPLHCFPQQLTT